MNLMKPIVGITMGDAAGIGPEIILKAVATDEIQEICRPLVIGDARVMKKALKISHVGQPMINGIDNLNDAKFSRGIINVLDLKNVDPDAIKVGAVNKICGKASVQAVEKAVELAMARQIHSIATAPINKEAMHKAGFKYAGHTEILAHKTNSKEYAMMFMSDELWVVLVTTHLPLAAVSKKLTKDNVLTTIRLADQAVRTLRGKKARVGVAGLNPHAGESGIFGNEERKIIAPAIAEAKKRGILAKGPFSPDAMFALARTGAFDVVVAMYHDQGLIPVKLLSFNKSVNITIGLPIIRTSVDHGTGYDIAGKGWANPTSMMEAIRVAALMASR